MIDPHHMSEVITPLENRMKSDANVTKKDRNGVKEQVGQERGVTIAVALLDEGIGREVEVETDVATRGAANESEKVLVKTEQVAKSVETTNRSTAPNLKTGSGPSALHLVLRIALCLQLRLCLRLTLRLNRCLQLRLRLYLQFRRKP